jgi:uncharacterized protein (DUF433 family)
MVVPVNDGIEINPNIMRLRPVIHGTRIPVKTIAVKLATGTSEQDLLDAYPGLQKEDVEAVRSLLAEEDASSATDTREDSEKLPK